MCVCIWHKNFQRIELERFSERNSIADARKFVFWTFFVDGVGGRNVKMT